MNRKFETKAIRTQLEKSQYQEHSIPLYLTSSYAFQSAGAGAEVTARGVYSDLLRMGSKL